MRHAAYLSPSRHGIFYFRQPIPAQLHPDLKRTDVKFSLGSRCPKIARQLSRVLFIYGQSLLAHPTVQSMNYPDIRSHVQNHFRAMLAAFKLRLTETGPISDDRSKALRDVINAAESNQDAVLDHMYFGDVDWLLREFCEAEGIAEPLTADDKKLILREYQRAYLQLSHSLLDHDAAFAKLDLDDLHSAAISTDCASQPINMKTDAETYRLSDVVKRHIDEGERSNLWMAKTLTEKRDALELLCQLVKDKPIGEVSKADARTVKAALQKLVLARMSSHEASYSRTCSGNLQG